MARPVSSKKRRALQKFAVALFFCTLTFAIDHAFYPYNHALPGSESGNRGTNGVWLHYRWYFGEHSDGETRQLARDLAERQIE